MRAGQLTSAVAHLEQTATRYPQAMEPWLGMGECWQQLGRAEEAERCYRKAVEADPEALQAWYRMGCLQSKDRPAEGAESFRRAIALKPDHTEAYFNLGQCLLWLGDRAGAAEAFRAAVRCDPGFEPAREALRKLPPASARP
jgi:Tfp pilus assembly protein PilF